MSGGSEQTEDARRFTKSVTVAGFLRGEAKAPRKMGGGGKDGTNVLPPPANGGGGAVDADSVNGVVASKRAYVQEECLPWMFERIKLARKSRGDVHFTEPQKIQIQEFLSSSSGAKLFAYETEDGQLRLDSNLSTQSKEVRARRDHYRDLPCHECCALSSLVLFPVIPKVRTDRP